MTLPQDYVAQLRTVFDLCDEQKSGFITVEQLVNLAKKYFGGSREDIENLLELLDPGGLGIIGFEEFCHGISSIVSPQEVQQYNNATTTNDETIQSQGTDPSCDQVSYTTYSEYDMADDDLLILDDGLPDRTSPESFQDADSAIVVPPGGSSVGSPELNRKNLLSVSDGEEKYECFGDLQWETAEEQQGKLAAKNHSSPNRNRRNQPFHSRNMWLRTSLRRAPSHLHRSSSFNSSRRSSSCESDDMNGDISPDDDVQGLNEKVQILQQQVTALANVQTSSDEKYNKVKQENASLMARIHSLEEQIREVEIRSEERIREEHQRFKELMARQDKEKCLEIEAYALRLHTLEKENQQLQADLLRLRSQIEKLKFEKSQLQDQLSDSEYVLSNVQGENQRLQELSRREREEASQARSANAQVIEELTKELQELRQYKAEMGPLARARSISSLELPSRYAELQEEMRRLREENRYLKDSKDELQAELLNTSIQEGKNLLHTGTNNSLAAEFEAMSKDEMMQALKDQQDVNAKLKMYIDSMLLNILENHPSILEVKGFFSK